MKPMKLDKPAIQVQLENIVRFQKFIKTADMLKQTPHIDILNQQFKESNADISIADESYDDDKFKSLTQIDEDFFQTLSRQPSFNNHSSQKLGDSLIVYDEKEEYNSSIDSTTRNIDQNIEEEEEDEEEDDDDDDNDEEEDKSNKKEKNEEDSNIDKPKHQKLYKLNIKLTRSKSDVREERQISIYDKYKMLYENFIETVKYFSNKYIDENSQDSFEKISPIQFIRQHSTNFDQKSGLQERESRKRRQAIVQSVKLQQNFEQLTDYHRQIITDLQSTSLRQKKKQTKISNEISKQEDNISNQCNSPLNNQNQNYDLNGTQKKNEKIKFKLRKIEKNLSQKSPLQKIKQTSDQWQSQDKDFSQSPQQTTKNPTSYSYQAVLKVVHNLNKGLNEVEKYIAKNYKAKCLDELGSNTAKGLIKYVNHKEKLNLFNLLSQTLMDTFQTMALDITEIFAKSSLEQAYPLIASHIFKIRNIYIGFKGIMQMYQCKDSLEFIKQFIDMIIDSFVSYYIKEIIGIPFIGTFTATIFVEGIKQLVYKVLKTF